MTISSRFPPAVAQAITALAAAGDRTVSREVARAIQEHVVASQSPRQPHPRNADADRADAASAVGVEDFSGAGSSAKGASSSPAMTGDDAPPLREDA